MTLRELLTAAVDGELTSAERKVAERLLRESETARTLFARLKADSARLKQLPRVSAPADLADNVLATIQDRALLPTPLPPSRKPTARFNWSRLPVWTNIVTAAAVLLVISTGSYLYFAASHDYWTHKDREAIVANPESKLPVARADEREPPDAVAVEKVTPDMSVPGPAETIVRETPRSDPESGPSPRVVEDALLSPPRDATEIESIQLDKIRVSRVFTIHDLPDDEAARTRLAAEMRKDELIRLDLFCHSSPKALDLVVKAFKSRGILVLTDSFVQEQLRKKVQPEVMIFTEVLTPDDVARLLTDLGAADRMGRGEFEALVAAPFLPADLTRLSRLLGVPSLEPKTAKGTTAVDIRKPLPEGTANQVAAALAKMGSGKSSPRKDERLAIVAAYSPANPQASASREIRQFLDRRGERRAEAKPLMLVIRTTK